MKKVITYVFFLLISAFTIAQAPQKMSYQAVIRNSTNVLLASTNIGMQISILQGSPSGTSVYTETQTPTTNANGLVSLEIGSGTVVFGNFSTINWANGPFYIKTETDPAGGTNYTITGTNQLLSVPFALYAQKSGNGEASGNAVGDIKYWNGTSWVFLSIGQPGQVLKVTPTNIPEWSNGQTSGTLSSVSTNNVSNVLAQQATIEGNVANGNGELVITRGFCYATTTNPTVSNSVITSGSGLGTFSGDITGLNVSTTYYVRAFSTTVAGTAYGNELTFTTMSGVIQLTTSVATDIAGCYASSGGTIITENGSAVTSSGVVFGTSPNPTTLNNVASSNGGTPFTVQLFTTNPNTLFYYRAFAQNATGTYYGNQLSFTTQNITTTVTTIAAIDIQTCSANVGLTVTSSNISAVQSQGVCFATTQNPTVNNNLGTDNGSSYTLSNLLPNTVYYARAYATTCATTTYGNQISFTTKPNTTVVTTTPVTGLNACSVTFNGNYTTNTGNDISNIGFCFGRNPNPTLETSESNIGAGFATNFSAEITCLIPGTTYYVAAYVQNCVGYVYGAQVTFTTPAAVNPVVTTNFNGQVHSCFTDLPLPTVNSTDAKCYNTTGICFGLTANPQLYDNNGNLPYSSADFYRLSNLSPQTIYYARAYIRLCDGTTVYGNQITFATPPKITSITTNAVTNITSGTAKLNAVTIGNNIDNVISGICFGLSPNPTRLTDDTDVSSSTFGNTYDLDIQNLTANTTYYARAYARFGYDGNCPEILYGNQVTFTTGPATPHVVGQNFDGGIIIWLNAAGTSGLIAATTDQGFGTWGCEGTNIAGTSTAQGTGQANTNAIVSGCAGNNAAKICNDLILNGKSDWYLPSEAELILIGELNYFPQGNYWSSSQLNATQAKFVNGITPGISNKSETNFKIRAIRSF